MNKSELKKVLSIILCVLVVLLAVTVAFSAFHHCNNHSACPVCSALNISFSIYAYFVMSAIIVSGIFYALFKLKINIKSFSLVEKQVRMNS